jgi:intermediate peptidase
MSPFLFANARLGMLSSWTKFARSTVLRTKFCHPHYRATRSTSTTAPAATPVSPGAFGLPGMHSPDDLLKFTEDAIQRTNNLKQRLQLDSGTNQPPNLLDVLSILDAISNSITVVLDVTSLCCQVHNNPEWRRVAETCHRSASSFIATLNMDTSLFEPLQLSWQAHQTAATASSLAEDDGDGDDGRNATEILTAEQERVIVALLSEFERDGVHLSLSSRQHVAAIHDDLTGIQHDFTALTRNVITPGKKPLENANTHVNVNWEELTAGMPEHIANALRARATPLTSVVSKGTRILSFLLSRSAGASETAAGENEDKQTMALPLDDVTVAVTLQHASQSNMRRKVMLAHEAYHAHQTGALVQRLRDKRHDLATSLGFPSFAAMTLQTCALKEPHAVNDFLVDLAEHIRPAADAEALQLSEKKVRAEGRGASSLMLWDVTRYTRSLNGDDQAGSTERAQEMARSYFSLSSCIGGLSQVCHKLFDIDIVDETERSFNEVWAPDVRKYTLREKDGSLVGTFFLDIQRRATKASGGAAQSQIVCGCAIPQGDLPPQAAYIANDQYQLPSVAVSCGFANPARMSFYEVRTLFHEFGHVLHALLSRTQFQFLSGTRCERDLVEVPSYLMEFMCEHAQVVKCIGKHYRTGEVIPDELVSELVTGKRSDSALALQTDVMHAMFDQALFTDCKVDPDTVLQRIFSKHSSVPHYSGLLHHTWNNHLITYGATYYSYLYSKVLAADIWDRWFAQDPFSREGGRALRESFLSCGGAKILRDVEYDLLGRRAKVGPMLARDVQR